MNIIEGFLMWFGGCFVGGIAIWSIYDFRQEKNEKRIAELEKENAELHFDSHRESAVREQFEKEFG